MEELFQLPVYLGAVGGSIGEVEKTGIFQIQGALDHDLTYRGSAPDVHREGVIACERLNGTRTSAEGR